MYAHQVLLVLTYFLRENSFVLAGNWTQWTDITLCNARPCKCFKEDENCKVGIKVQLRRCIPENGSVCKYDNHVGPLRKTSCTNENVCPGWSDFQVGTCNCTGFKRLLIQFCTNPGPIHPDIYCKDPDMSNLYLADGKNGVLVRDQEEDCNCTIAEINECNSDPCKNGGTCENEHGRYKCFCEPGYTGNDCSINIDDCEPNRCINNGTCVDKVNGYTCVCTRFYDGRYCEREIPPCEKVNGSRGNGGDIDKKTVTHQAPQPSMFDDIDLEDYGLHVDCMYEGGNYDESTED